MKSKKTKKDLDELSEKGLLDDGIRDSYIGKISQYKEKLNKLKKEVDEREQKNLERFKNLPKGRLLQFGEFQIYVSP